MGFDRRINRAQRKLDHLANRDVMGRRIARAARKLHHQAMRPLNEMFALGVQMDADDHKEAPVESTTRQVRTFRTFESFDIVWDRGSTWTNYDSAEDAQRTIDGSASDGTVVRRSWEVELRPDMLAAGMYQPGCGDRTEAV